MTEFNKLEKVSEIDIKTAKEFMTKTDEVLGLIKQEKEEISEELINLAEQRKIVKENKNWGDADLLRKQISELGYDIRDDKNSNTGYILKKK